MSGRRIPRLWQRLSLAAAIAWSLTLVVQAEPVTAEADHARLLAGADARLTANKHRVYDFWREVIEGGHLELADRYLSENYRQHNPNVPGGRAGFVAYFSQFAKPRAIEARIRAPLVAIVAEGDLVVLSFVATHPEPNDPARQYTTTWFDMFRLVDGKIVEHWDGATREH